jgi:hypothetical protein
MADKLQDIQKPRRLCANLGGVNIKTSSEARIHLCLRAKFSVSQGVAIADKVNATHTLQEVLAVKLHLAAATEDRGADFFCAGAASVQSVGRNNCCGYSVGDQVRQGGLCQCFQALYHTHFQCP